MIHTLFKANNTEVIIQNKFYTRKMKFPSSKTNHIINNRYFFSKINTHRNFIRFLQLDDKWYNSNEIFVKRIWKALLEDNWIPN